MFKRLIVLKKCLETNPNNEEMNFMALGDFVIVWSLIVNDMIDVPIELKWRNQKKADRGVRPARSKKQF